MRTRATPGGPFAESVYYTDREIENTCVEELRNVGLMPTSPEPIRVDRFVEKRFRVTPRYEELPEGVLGFTKFGSHGVEEMVVSRALADEGSKTAECRIKSTLAHESGHALLQIHLFALAPPIGSPRLMEDGIDLKQGKVLCRTESVDGEQQARKYDGRWWEVQANKAIGGLLMPRSLVDQVLRTVIATRGIFEMTTVAPEVRPRAIRVLAETFEVSATVARIRLDQLFPVSNSGQLTL